MVRSCTLFLANLAFWLVLAAPSPPPAPSRYGQHPSKPRRLGLWSAGRPSPRTLSSPAPDAIPGTARSASEATSWSATMEPMTSGTPDTPATARPRCRSATPPHRDGIHWTRDPGNPIFAESWVEDMCVVHQDGTYFMVAEGKNDVAHLLKSTDGRKWTDHGSLDIRKRDGKPIDPGPYGTPTVWFENGTWYLFYERGDQGIWLAVSKDLKVWTNVQDDPVIAMGPEPYDKTAVALNQIVKRDGFYYAFYHANSNRPWKNWTTCVARSRDLVHWEKYPGNPIIENNCSSAILVQTPQGEDRLYTMHPDVKVFVPK